MMLHERLQSDVKAAARIGNTRLSNLLKTLYADTVAVARAKENRNPTDDEVIKTVRKFVSNAGLVAETLENQGRDSSTHRAEMAILSAYLPQGLSEDEIVAALSEGRAAGTIPAGPAGTGAAMKLLKERFADRFDGKSATPVVKAFLAA